MWQGASAERNSCGSHAKRMCPSRALAERLRQAVAERGAGIGAPPVTISVGLATMRNEDSGLGLFARADQALYQAKDQGRNTVRMAA